MRLFAVPKEQFSKVDLCNYQHLTPYLEKLRQAEKVYPEACDNEEYMSYVKYSFWPIRQMEYSFMLEKALPCISEGIRLLDAGCGVTPFPFLCADAGAQVTAIDFDPANISLMEKLRDDDFFQTGKAIDLQVADIVQLPFADGSFDVVCSTSVIEHLALPNYLLALYEFYRVLKPGGTLIFTTDINASHNTKISAVGAFSIDDITNILTCFSDELSEDCRDIFSLRLTEGDIEHFWMSHYEDGIGYTENRGYVAIGISLQKKAWADSGLKIMELLSGKGLVALLQKNYADSCTSRRELDTYIHMAREIQVEAEKRLENVNTLTAHINGMGKTIEQKDQEIIVLNAEADKRLQNIKAVEAQLDNLKDVVREKDREILALNTEVDRQLEKLMEMDRLFKQTSEALESLEERSGKLANISAADQEFIRMWQTEKAAMEHKVIFRVLRKLRMF